MKILITGDAGFVGKHFHKKYQEHDITGVDIVNGLDARDFFKVNDQYFDLVIHLAAVVGGRLTIENSPMSVAVDLSIDAEMWNWALRTKPGRVVYFSSSAAYPNKLQVKGTQHLLTESDIDLNDVSSPDLTYGWSKLTGEYQSQFVEAEGVKVNVFRPFSGYGCDQALDYPFPSFIKRGKLKANPFEIWGDGTQIRDFIHIKDIVDAVDEVIKQDITGPVNLGSGRPTSFNNLCELITNAAGYTPEVRHLTANPTGVYHRVSEPSRMLGFYTPKIDLEKGIELALKGIA